MRDNYSSAAGRTRRKKNGAHKSQKTSSADHKKWNNSTIHVYPLIITYNCIRKKANQ
jgi:hypothetical protein